VELRSFEQAGPANRDELLEYLRADLGNCLYLTLDVDMYEIGGGTIDVWVQRGTGGGIVAVAMRYADSFQLYAREVDLDRVDYSDLVKLISSTDAMRVSAPGGIIRNLLDSLGETYDDSYGVVMEMVKYRPMALDDIEIIEASREDIPEIVNLILMDEMFGQSYEPHEMVRQFEARYDEGSGASYIIKAEGKIVAHLGFAAIGRDFVIASYTIVHPEYRSFPYGALLDSDFINNTLPSIGKRGFAFMQEPRRIKLFEIMGNPIIGEYGKLLKKR
jgi:hypothetical protein